MGAVLLLSVGALVSLGTIPAVAARPHARVAQFPVSVKATNGTVQITARPSRVISLSPTATEDLFAIGAGRQVIAVDDESDYPPSAPRTALSGYQPNVEAIARYAPDLVVIAENVDGLLASLAKLHIPVLLEPAASTLSQAYGEMTALGVATGHRKAAGALVSRTRTSVAHLVKAAPHFPTQLSYYYELDQTYYSETSSTFIGRLLGLFNLRDIADEAGGTSGGYPQLSAEYIIHAAPDLIILADTRCCHQSAATVRARPGWASIPAVEDGDVVPLDDDIASRWGPRLVILARDIEQALWKYSRQH